MYSRMEDEKKERPGLRPRKASALNHFFNKTQSASIILKKETNESCFYPLNAFIVLSLSVLSPIVYFYSKNKQQFLELIRVSNDLRDQYFFSPVDSSRTTCNQWQEMLERKSHTFRILEACRTQNYTMSNEYTISLPELCSFLLKNLCDTEVELSPYMTLDSTLTMGIICVVMLCLAALPTANSIFNDYKNKTHVINNYAEDEKHQLIEVASMINVNLADKSQHQLNNVFSNLTDSLAIIQKRRVQFLLGSVSRNKELPNCALNHTFFNNHLFEPCIISEIFDYEEESNISQLRSPTPSND